MITPSQPLCREECVWNQTNNTYYDTLQSAIDCSVNDDVLLITSNEIQESVTIDSKSLTISSTTEVMFKQTHPPASQAIYITGPGNITLDGLLFDNLSAAIVIEDSLSGTKIINNNTIKDCDHFLLVGNTVDVMCRSNKIINKSTAKNSWKLMIASGSDDKKHNFKLIDNEFKHTSQCNMIYTDSATLIDRCIIDGASVGLWVDGGNVVLYDSIIKSRVQQEVNSLILVTGTTSDVIIDECEFESPVSSGNYIVDNHSNNTVDATNNYWGEQLIYNGRDLTTLSRINNSNNGHVRSSPYYMDQEKTELVYE